MERYSDLQQALIAEGYHEGAPSGAVAHDKPIAEAQYCPNCGTGMQYKPWTKRLYERNPATGRHETSSYRAFCVCPRCDVCIEF